MVRMHFIREGFGASEALDDPLLTAALHLKTNYVRRSTGESVAGPHRGDQRRFSKNGTDSGLGRRAAQRAELRNAKALFALAADRALQFQFEAPRAQSPENPAATRLRKSGALKYLDYRSATRSSRSKNSGNEMAADSAPRISVSPCARSAAAAKAIAMR